MQRILFAAALLLPISAFAQSAPPTNGAPAPSVDPRLAEPQINALQALLKLREAEIRAMWDDTTKNAGKLATADEAHQKTWAEWYASHDKEWADWFAAYERGIEDKLTRK